VYSRKESFTSEDPERPVETTCEDPQVLLERLTQRGFKEVAICGGAEIYTIFAKAGLVSKVYLTIEPVELHHGIHMFNDGMLMESMSTWVKTDEKRLPTGTEFYEYHLGHKD
jgi:dihydrofolate reductase